MKKILITVGTGLLGKALIETNKSYDIKTVFLGNYVISDNKNVKYYNCDIRSDDFTEKVLNDFKPEVIIHTAGIANVDYCENNPEEARDSNINGTEHMLELCKKYNEIDLKPVHVAIDTDKLQAMVK